MLRLTCAHVPGEVAEQSRVEDAFGEGPATVDHGEAIAVLARQDRVQTLAGHLQNREVAAGARPAPSTVTVTFVSWWTVRGVPSSYRITGS